MLAPASEITFTARISLQRPRYMLDASLHIFASWSSDNEWSEPLGEASPSLMTAAVGPTGRKVDWVASTTSDSTLLGAETGAGASIRAHTRSTGGGLLPFSQTMMCF